MKYYLPTIVILSLLLTACSENESATAEQETSKTTSEVKSLAELTAGIRPPVPGIGVAFAKEKLAAETGGSFVYETGSVVTFPPNAVLHKDGTPVIGAYDVEYREFQDPIDMYFSGIPMGYDSAGIEYNFISAGMCELKASQNGEALYVNPEAYPSVSMVSRDNDPAHNLYYFDESTNQWISKGKPTINDIAEPVEEKSSKESAPVKPVKEDPAKHSFFITIDESMKIGSEFEGFDQMSFQIADEEKGYDPADAKNYWTGVNVEKSKKYKGKYVVTFTGVNITKSYLTDPVFSPADYEKAMANYNKVLAEYEAKVKEAEKKQAAWEADQAAIMEQNRKIDSVNQLIAIQNEINRKYNDSIDQIKKVVEEFDTKRFNFIENTYIVTQNLVVDGFGVWNCDNPAFKSGFIMTKALFEGLKLESPYYELNPDVYDKYVTLFSVIYEGYNSVMQNQVGEYKNLPNVTELLFAVDKETLYVLRVTGDETEVTKKPKEINIKGKTFKEIKSILVSL